MSGIGRVSQLKGDIFWQTFIHQLLENAVVITTGLGFKFRQRISGISEGDQILLYPVLEKLLCCN
jgi:hypothetical protein